MSRQHRKSAAKTAFEELNREDQLEHLIAAMKHMFPFTDGENETVAQALEDLEPEFEATEPEPSEDEPSEDDD